MRIPPPSHRITQAPTGPGLNVDAPIERRRIQIRGAVQGVGFRPFIYRLATDLGLAGAVWNGPEGLTIEVEGIHSRLDIFLRRVERERPTHGVIDRIDCTRLAPTGADRFEIRESDLAGAREAWVLPDLATCADCLKEIFDPRNRRYRYPFTNCTRCGPRFSIIEALPYDRAHTAMRRFPLCAGCRAEYDDPSDRRFHAEAIVCPACGPSLQLWDGKGKQIASDDSALREAAETIRIGKIVAVKGLGGFHLIVDARNKEAVRQLRRRKGREGKPFALMFPTLESIKTACQVLELEARLLLSPEAPIVLLKKIAPSVSPDIPSLGIMLPYTPLHHLLMSELAFPVVATSGNRSDEPICTDEQEALHRLDGIADLFLVHNRPIVSHVDDSIVRVIAGRPMILRRARGYASLPISTGPDRSPRSLLAVGGHLKNTVALSEGKTITVSQHIGDLDTPQADATFRKVISDLTRLHGRPSTTLICDTHPDYHSTQFAQATGPPLIHVQHHYAHVLSCMGDNELDAPLLGVAWDGSGYGSDGTLWGGEFLKITETSFVRSAHLRPFRLPGGERAIKEPRRAAIGLLYECFKEDLFKPKGDRVDLRALPLRTFSETERLLLKQILARGFQASLTSSAGRLFDAVASLLDLRQTTRFEGEAAMALEYAAEGFETEETYPFRIVDCGLRNEKFSDSELRAPNSPLVIDWSPMISSILADLERFSLTGRIAAIFHNTLTELIVETAKRIGEERVLLTGGCFQNKRLTERTIKRLREEGFQPYWHQRIPPNDGGLALGQILAAIRSDGRGEAAPRLPPPVL